MLLYDRNFLQGKICKKIFDRIKFYNFLEAQAPFLKKKFCSNYRQNRLRHIYNIVLGNFRDFLHPGTGSGGRNFFPEFSI